MSCLSKEHRNIIAILARAGQYETGLRETGDGEEHTLIAPAISRYTRQEERDFFEALFQLERWEYVYRREVVDAFDSAYYRVTWRLTERG